jgi:hypothetical protein
MTPWDEISWVVYFELSLIFFSIWLFDFYVLWYREYMDWRMPKLPIQRPGHRNKEYQVATVGQWPDSLRQTRALKRREIERVRRESVLI